MFPGPAVLPPRGILPPKSSRRLAISLLSTLPFCALTDLFSPVTVFWFSNPARVTRCLQGCQHQRCVIFWYPVLVSWGRLHFLLKVLVRLLPFPPVCSRSQKWTRLKALQQLSCIRCMSTDTIRNFFFFDFGSAFVHSLSEEGTISFFCFFLSSVAARASSPHDLPNAICTMRERSLPSSSRYKRQIPPQFRSRT